MNEQQGNTTGIVIGVGFFALAAWGLYELYFKKESHGNLSGSKLKVGVKKTPFGYMVRGGGVWPTVMVKSKKEADMIARVHREYLKKGSTVNPST